MITARSAVVGLPPGHYDKIAQVIRDKIRCGYELRERFRGPYKRTRPSQNSRRNIASRYLLAAAIDDPDELQELWNRASL